MRPRRHEPELQEILQDSGVRVSSFYHVIVFNSRGLNAPPPACASGSRIRIFGLMLGDSRARNRFTQALFICSSAIHCQRQAPFLPSADYFCMEFEFCSFLILMIMFYGFLQINLSKAVTTSVFFHNTEICTNMSCFLATNDAAADIAKMLITCPLCRCL